MSDIPIVEAVLMKYTPLWRIYLQVCKIKRFYNRYIWHIIFARADCDVIALHDCDIVTYDRILIEPTANPNNDFEFCKGFYPRISPTERVMKGRVTRLFVTPFVDTMSTIMYERGHNELVRFFRYHRTFSGRVQFHRTVGQRDQFRI